MSTNLGAQFMCKCKQFCLLSLNQSWLSSLILPGQQEIPTTRFTPKPRALMRTQDAQKGRLASDPSRAQQSSLLCLGCEGGLWLKARLLGNMLLLQYNLWHRSFCPSFKSLTRSDFPGILPASLWDLVTEAHKLPHRVLCLSQRQALSSGVWVNVQGLSPVF